MTSRVIRLFALLAAVASTAALANSGAFVVKADVAILVVKNTESLAAKTAPVPSLSAIAGKARERAAPPSSKPLFAPAVAYGSGGAAAFSVAIGDFNGDGKPDLVAANVCCSVDVLLGNGDGTFQAAQNFDLGTFQPSSVAAADVNGDGKLDLIITGASSSGCVSSEGSVEIMLGNGDGTFQPVQSYASGGLCPTRMAVADVNANGKLDVVVVNLCAANQSFCTNSQDGVVGVLLGNGDGTFATAQTYDSGSEDPDDIALSDVNRDGKIDLIVTNFGCSCGVAGNVAVFLGGGNGTFQPARTFASGTNGLRAVAVGDLNGDGNPDIVVATCFDSNCTGGAGVMLGNGDGTFQPLQVYESGGWTPVSIALTDVNRDGNLDVVEANFLTGAQNINGGVSVLLGNGDGTLALPSATFKAGGGYAEALAIADVNHDGRVDIVVANQFTVCNVNHLCNPGALGVLLGQSLLPTTASITSSLNPSLYGQSIIFTSKVTNSGGTVPTGTVTFSWSGNNIGSAKLNSSGVATLTKSNLNVGDYPIVASYGGDGNDSGSTSSILNQVVQQTASATTLTSSPNPSTHGQTVVFNANVSSPTTVPKGQVIFSLGTKVLATVNLSNGKARFTTSTLPTGTDVVKATFNGDSNVSGSSATVTQTVQ